MEKTSGSLILRCKLLLPRKKDLIFCKIFPLCSQHKWCSISTLCTGWTAQGKAIFSLCILENYLQISWDFQRQICRKIWVKFSQKTIAKKGQFCRNKISLESNRFCADFTNVFNETRQQFCQFLGRGE